MGSVGIAASPGRGLQDELQDEPLGVPYGGLLDGEERELGEGAGVEEVEGHYRQVGEEVEFHHMKVDVEVGVHHRQVGEVQSLLQVCLGKDRRLLLPQVSLLGEGNHCSPHCSP